MGKINTNNYPNRPVSDYQDDDMFILQDNGGETYTTNVGDIKDLIGEETDPKLALKVDKNGTDRLMTAAEGTKLAGIAAGAQVNVLEGVVVDSVEQPISGKKAFIDLSGKTNLSVIAFPFHDPVEGEPSMGFFKGAYVTYNGKLYEFTQEHQGAWNPSHVREINAAGWYVRVGNGGYNSGDYATTEGHSTRAEGEAAHAEGTGTIANSDNQHAGGRYNVADPDNTYVRIIGNGTADNARSNALTLDWDGNLAVSGDVENGNGEKLSDKADKVTNATSGHLAGLDANGNLTDSGVSPTEDVTVEGNPVQFDSPFEQDAKSVVVSVKPIQDLHGYDHPWPAGGGKNKAKPAYTGNTVGMTVTEIKDDGDNILGYKFTGTSLNTSGTVLYDFPVSASDTDYKIIRSDVPQNVNSFVWDSTASTSITIVGNTVTAPANHSVHLAVIIPTGTELTNATMQFMLLETTESDATFAPYSNECPISGTDEVEIEVSGKNLCSIDNSSFISNASWVDLEGDAAGTYRGTKLTLLAGTYFVKLHDTVNVLDLQVYNQVTENLDIADLNGGSIILPSDGDIYIRVKATVGSQTSFKTQVELGSTPTTYEPYTGHTTTIPLPQTVYDADVDVTNGSGDDNKGFVEFDGSVDEDWQMEGASTAASGSKRFILTNVINYPALPSSYYPLNVITNGLGLASGDASWAGGVDNVISISSSGTNINIRVAEIDTVEGLKTWLSNNPVQVCYELATPTTLSFDPTDVELLEGTNVVTTNGEKVAVTYGRSLWQDIDELKTDTEGKLDKSDVADVEGDTASRPYSVNEFMLRSDGFYKVTQPIAQNASITASNTTKTTVGEVLTALLNA